MTNPESRLEALARQVAEGTAIDWPRAERDAADSDERRVVRELRTLAELSDVHHTLQRTPPSDGANEPLADTLPVETPRYWGDFEILEKVGERLVTTGKGEKAGQGVRIVGDSVEEDPFSTLPARHFSAAMYATQPGHASPTSARLHSPLPSSVSSSVPSQ